MSVQEVSVQEVAVQEVTVQEVAVQEVTVQEVAGHPTQDLQAASDASFVFSLTWPKL